MKDLFKEILKIKFHIVIMGLLLTFCSSPVESENSNQSELTLEKQIELIEKSDLSNEEAEGLVFMREEEKLARDVYKVLYEKWNLKPFYNISQSEQKHMDAIKILLDRYGLEDPVVDDETGKFVNLDLQSLYNNLVTSGSESSLAALKVGAAIEEIDILDLQEQLNDVVDNEDIILVYNNLTRGSRNHLRAFVRNITSLGESYEPQYLSAEEFTKIITSEQETGMGNRKGRNGKNNR